MMMLVMIINIIGTRHISSSNNNNMSNFTADYCQFYLYLSICIVLCCCAILFCATLCCVALCCIPLHETQLKLGSLWFIGFLQLNLISNTSKLNSNKDVIVVVIVVIVWVAQTRGCWCVAAAFGEEDAALQPLSL